MVHMASPKSKQSKDDHEKVLRIKHTIAKNMMNPFSMNMAKVSSHVRLLFQKSWSRLRAASASDAEKISVPKIIRLATQQKKGKQKQENVKAVISEENSLTRDLCITQDFSDEGTTKALSHV